MQEKDLMNALGNAVKKLRECQDEMEPDEPLPWFETLRLEQCLVEFERDGMKLTIGEGVAYETFSAAMGRFELLAEESARVAKSPDQVKAATALTEHVAGLNQSMFGRTTTEPDWSKPFTAADLLKPLRELPKPANDRSKDEMER